MNNGNDFKRPGLVAVGDDVRANIPEAVSRIRQIFPMMTYARRLCQAREGVVQPFQNPICTLEAI